MANRARVGFLGKGQIAERQLGYLDHPGVWVNRCAGKLLDAR